MQGKSEKNADSLTFMCYSVTLVTLTIAKEAPASLRGLPSLWQQKTTCWGLRVGDCVLGRVALLQAGEARRVSVEIWTEAGGCPILSGATDEAL